MSQASVFSATVYERLPLAQATLELAAFVLQPDQLDDFARQHDVGGTRLLFPEFLTLIRDALLRYHGSLRRAYRSRPAAVSVQSVYQRLAHVTLAQSEAFVARFARPLGELVAPSSHSPVPRALRDFDVYVLDGKKLKKVAKRLAQTRGVAGKLFGGKLLVCLNLHTGLVEALSAHPDGEANDCALVGPLLEQPRFAQPSARRRLFVADRQFGNLTQPVQLAAARDAYLVRRSRTAAFHPDPERPARAGTDGRGQRYEEAWGWLGSGAHRLYIRQVTLHRADPVILMTNLVDAAEVSAGALLDLYAQRWGIEKVFQQVTEVFSLARFIGSTPEASVFQAAFCLLLYNLIVVEKSYLAAAAGWSPEDVSTEQLFRDVRDELVGLQTVVDPAEVARLVVPPPAAAGMRDRLRVLLSPVWDARKYRKAKNPSPRKPATPAKGSGAHTSVYRILQQHPPRTHTTTPKHQ
jgi:hypothetical protein